MKEKERRLSDFDWVTARHVCSAVNVFELLRLQALKNVETINTARGLNGPEAWQFATGDSAFSIVRRAFHREIGVRFVLKRDQIIVGSQGVRVEFVAELTLNNDGDCRLSVGGEELELWQVLRRALEPLFFWSV